MQIDRKILRSKVSRRIFILFVSCALLPIAILTVLSSIFLGEELRDQASERRNRRTKSIAMSIVGRIVVAESELRTLALVIESGAGIDGGRLAEIVGRRIRGLALVSDERSEILFGALDGPFPAVPAAPGPVMQVRTNPGDEPEVRLAIPLTRPGGERAMLVGRIDSDYLWDLAGGLELTSGGRLLVLDAQQKVIFSSTPGDDALPPAAVQAMQNELRGGFAWPAKNGDELAQFWSVYLKPHFGYPNFTIVLSEPADRVLAPLVKARRLLPQIIALCLLVVVLASVVQIRRSLVPIISLSQGTRQIAAGHFDARVAIDSRDEFQELAESFNAMASRIGEQFTALSTLAEFDRAILSTWKEEEIVATVLTRMPQRLACDSLAVTLLDDADPSSVLTHAYRTAENLRVTEAAVLPLHERRALIDTESVTRIPRERLPDHLSAILDRRTAECLVFPILRQEIAGCVTLGYNEPHGHREEQVTEARRLTDEIAVALSNARLVDRLDRTNWETLHALARAVDANSPWTSGHSERVTQMAVRLASRLELPERELVILHKGGLLHDLGKIGVPQHILNKPGRLTEEEYRQIQRHVTIGARILEPISAYRDEIPIVLYHHERFDGSGYPEGLVGEQIPYHARILAVADVYDALSSQRPYRKALEPEQAVEFIAGHAGSQFDPQIVSVFVDLMRGAKRAEEEPSCLNLDAGISPYGRPLA